MELQTFEQGFQTCIIIEGIGSTERQMYGFRTFLINQIKNLTAFLSFQSLGSYI